MNIESVTIAKYLKYFEEAFLINSVNRYDVKGRKYIKTQAYYYFTDLGLRNTILDFRQLEENHILENIIYNELKGRGFSIDVGIVEYRHKNQADKDVRDQLEVDFVATNVQKIYYVQVALNIDIKV